MNQSYGYKANVKARFQKQVNEITARHNLTELVIVLDLNTAFVLSNIFKVTQLVAMKINYIERLEKKRKKLNKHALYFISSTQQSVNLLNKDFQAHDKASSDQYQYRRVHILFSSFIDKRLLKMIATNPILMKKIAKNSIKEFYCSNRILGDNLVDAGIQYLPYAYSKESQGEQLRRNKLSQKFIEYLANFKEINTVKIYYKKSPNLVCEKMASELEVAVKKYLGILIQNKSCHIVKEAKDITFLLLDRSVDPITPLLHYFTYEGLLFDLFDINMVGKSQLKDQGAYSYQEIQNQSYELFRHKHISEALQKIPQSLQRQKSRLDAIKTGGHEQINIQTMSDRIADLKSNIDKLQMIWKKFQQMKLDQLSELQLSLATGLTSNGSNTSSSKLIQDVKAIIQNNQASKLLKLRLALLCLCCIKLSKHDYMELIELFGEEDKKVLKNINHLGVTYDSSLSKSTKTITKQQQNVAKQRMNRTGMPLNRYTSILQFVIPLFLKVLTDPNQQRTIDQDIFGQITCSIFNQSSNNRFDASKICITMIGGMSWAQISALRSIPEIENVVLISDSIYNPQQYIKSLGQIK